MIDGVLAYSSLNAVEQKIQRLNLNHIIEEIKADVEVLIEQKRAAINFEELPEIDGVQVLIYQVFYNLINNSLKFSKPEVPPVISIRSETVAQEENPIVRIVVSDNGIGFSPEHNEEIFKTFTRLNSKSHYDGTGLGLSLVKKIVERHQGTIEAHGREGEGATFILSLPVYQGVKV